jgi:hypothetical protein
MERLPSDPRKTLLYALQQQPEANIDVWGQPYSNQVSVLRDMLDAAPQDVHVAVKMNPMPRYALSRSLMQLAEEEQRISLLPAGMSMADAHRHTTGSLTVTGTVGFEAIFGRGRCLSLKHPLIAEEFPSFHASSIKCGVDRLLQDQGAGVGSVRLGARLIQSLVRRSYRGLVGDPVMHPACIEKENVLLLANSVQDFLLSLPRLVPRNDAPASWQYHWFANTSKDVAPTPLKVH